MKRRKQTVLSKKESPLLTYAISKLRPGVFSHPVWVRFGNHDKPVSPKTIQDLFGEAEYLQHDSPSDACQVLLICAVYQNYSGEKVRALTTIQKSLDLAEHNGLSHEILWAIWGACAVCMQQENYEQAAFHFGHLQSRLHEQNEWILADYVDVVRQFLLCSDTTRIEKYSKLAASQQFEYLLSRTFDWLHQWGYSGQAGPLVPSDQPISSATSQEPLPQSLFSARRHQEPWRTLKLMFRGELKLDWMKNDFPHTKGVFSFWGYILSSLRVCFSSRKTDAQIIDANLLISNSAIPQKATEDFLPNTLSPKQEEKSKSKPLKATLLLEQPPAIISVSVHLLGRFSMSIQDMALKLPTPRSLSLLKYLMLHHKQSVPREVLMDVFWPDAGPETARNNLNVAMHSIRTALRPMIYLPVILYKEGVYSIAPQVQCWLDVEEFQRLVSAGQRLESRNRLAAVPEYEAAISIYQGDFLEENPYEGWAVLTRESLRTAYLTTLDSLSQIYFSQQRYAACIRTCQIILTRDRCREDAHCMLMRCFSHQGQDYLALRQYHVCAEALRLELDVAPAPTTTHLFEQIRKHKPV